MKKLFQSALTLVILTFALILDGQVSSQLPTGDEPRYIATGLSLYHHGVISARHHGSTPPESSLIMGGPLIACEIALAIAINPELFDILIGFIRGSTVTSVADTDGRQLKYVLRKDNTASDVWADSAYRSKSNKKWLAKNMLTSQIHRRKPAGKPMSKATSRADAKKSSIRALVEHVFAHQKNRYGLFIRTIGIAQVETKLI